jgi:hypothetical protein
MLSLNVPSTRLNDRATAVGFRDEIRISSRVAIGGEVTSDGSYFTRAAYVARRFDVQASYRKVVRDDPSRDSALMASYALGRGVMLQAGLRGFETPAGSGRSRLLSARVPVGSVAALTFEDNRTSGGDSTDVSNAIGLQLLRGPVRLSQRYQWGDTEYLHAGGPFGVEQRQLQTSASFAPARWATFNPQTVTQWLPDGRARQWQELESVFALSPSTRLQLYTPIPDLADRTRFRSRFTQRLPAEFTLVLDYGQVAAFQSATFIRPDEPRVSVLLRKTWRTPTPARGGEVSGRVLDQRGRPVSEAGVRLGTYLTLTDHTGRYLFPRVPHGTFDLAIAPELLPAQYKSDGTSRRMVMSGAARHVADLTIVPLDSIRGHVYDDRNGDGRFDTGEGRAGIVLRLANQLTVTGPDGSYGFYNLPPGTHVVQLDAEGLARMRLTAPDTLVVLQLRPGEAATGCDFRIAEIEKPTILQPFAR